MPHHYVEIPVPDGLEVTAVHWHLSTSAFDAVVEEYRLAPYKVEKGDGDTFRAAKLKIVGFAEVGVYESDVGSVVEASAR